MKSTALVLLLVLTALVGCGNPSYEYSVSIKNETTYPLTIGFTKEGPQDQDLWIAPETVALDRSIEPARTIWGEIGLPPGKTATNEQPLVATLPDGANAYMRVYRGKLFLIDVLAMSPGSAGRVDVALRPGKNSIVIVERDGKLAAVQGQSTADPKK